MFHLCPKLENKDNPRHRANKGRVSSLIQNASVAHSIENKHQKLVSNMVRFVILFKYSWLDLIQLLMFGQNLTTLAALQKIES